MFKYRHQIHLFSHHWILCYVRKYCQNPIIKLFTMKTLFNMPYISLNDFIWNVLSVRSIMFDLKEHPFAPHSSHIFTSIFQFMLHSLLEICVGEICVSLCLLLRKTLILSSFAYWTTNFTLYPIYHLFTVSITFIVSATFPPMT